MGTLAIFQYPTNPPHASGCASELIEGIGGAGTQTKMYGKVKRQLHTDVRFVKMALNKVC